jgi:DNA-binding NarL/FixJ family response regulator
VGRTISNVPVRVLVVDPQPFFCESLASALQEDERLEVIGWTADPHDAAGLSSTLAPDVILCELELATTPAFGLLDREDGVKVIVLTRGHEGDALLPVAAAGAAGCIGHDIGLSDLCGLVADAGDGRFAVNPERLGDALRRAATHTEPNTQITGEANKLTLREREVLALLSEGLDNDAIATRLHLSAHTARTHVANILRKLGVGSRAEAARIALRARAGDPEVSVLRIKGPKLGER